LIFLKDANQTYPVTQSHPDTIPSFFHMVRFMKTKHFVFLFMKLQNFCQWGTLVKKT